MSGIFYLPSDSANGPIRMLSLVPRDRIGPSMLPCILLDMHYVGNEVGVSPYMGIQ